MEIQWHDVDPETGKRRYLRAERFAGVWTFKSKLQRRGEWTKNVPPTRAFWEHVRETLERRYWRREGVEERDIAQVQKILNDVIRDETLRASDDIK